MKTLTTLFVSYWATCFLLSCPYQKANGEPWKPWPQTWAPGQSFTPLPNMGSPPSDIAPWWQGLNAQVQAFGPTPKPIGELKQQRTHISLPGMQKMPATPTIRGLPTIPDDLWKSTNTGHAVQELATRMDSIFQSTGSGAPSFGGGFRGATTIAPPPIMPLENMKNAVMELTNLSKAVTELCEEDLKQKKSNQQFGQLTPIFRGDNTTRRFQVEPFLEQISEYTRRMDVQIRAARDLLNSIQDPMSNKASMTRHVQQYKAAMGDSRAVHRMGSEVISAVLGLLYMYSNTCSFLADHSPGSAHSNWSFAGARIASTARYLTLAIDTLRKASPALVDLISGTLRPQSIEDFARSKAFFKATVYLGKAEERSLSAVSYFNKFALAYDEFTRLPTNVPTQQVDMTMQHQRPEPQGQEVNQTEMQGDYNEMMSLMAEDLGTYGNVQLDGKGEHVLDKRDPKSFANDSMLQSIVDYTSYDTGVNSPRNIAVEEDAEQDEPIDDEMQTVGGD